TDNSGNANDSSIKFTTKFPLRKNYAESDFVRPNFADTTKYFDITNTGTGILQVSDIVSNVAGVTTNFVDDLLINPGESQRIQLTYDPSAARENFSVADGLILFTNDLNLPQYAIALNGKSTFNSDINYDGQVGAGDLGALNNASKNFKNGIYDPTADIDGNGLINSADLTVLLSENKLKLSLV
ncbi:MAG: dockerin type I domain-containing protein, partial [Microcystaceae cyanobacterium]